MLVEQLLKEQTTTPPSPPKPNGASASESNDKGQHVAAQEPGQDVRSVAEARIKREVELPPHLQNIQKLLQQVLAVIGVRVKPVYILLDGAFGHNKAVQMVQRCGLQLISRLHHNAALFFPYAGEQKKFGVRRKYGDKLDPQQIPACYQKASRVEDECAYRHLSDDDVE